MCGSSQSVWVVVLGYARPRLVKGGTEVLSDDDPKQHMDIIEPQDYV